MIPLNIDLILGSPTIHAYRRRNMSKIVDEVVGAN